MPPPGNAKHANKIRYDGKELTPEKLKHQIRCYHAVNKIIEETHLDFIGIKAQPDLTEITLSPWT